MKESPADSSSAALRAFTLLELIVAADAAISMADLVERTALPKPTVFRILTLLEAAGLVVREPKGKAFTVGPRLARLGRNIMMNNSVRAQRHAILRRVAEQIGETCNLTMMEDDAVVYVDRVETQFPLKIDFQPGSRVPLHCSASGKLFLSQMPQAKRRAMLETLLLTRYTSNTVTHLDLLEAELDRVAANRVGIDNEEYLAGLICVAVPVTDSRGKIIACLAVQAPAARLSLSRAMEHLPALQRAADAMAVTFDASSQEAENGSQTKRTRRVRETKALPLPKVVA